MLQTVIQLLQFSEEQNGTFSFYFRLLFSGEHEQRQPFLNPTLWYQKPPQLDFAHTLGCGAK